MTDTRSTFELWHSFAQVALTERHHPYPIIGPDEAHAVRKRLGHLKPFFAEDSTLGEHTQLGMTPGENSTGECGREENIA